MYKVAAALPKATAPRFDVAVVGGGPSGATAARLLASWGYRVAVLDRPRRPELALVESLPPSSRRLLSFLGMLDTVAGASFEPTRGNTTWWAEDEARVEPFAPAGAEGFQVPRHAFDALLLESAERAGATVWRGTAVREIDEAGGLQCEGPEGQVLPLSASLVLDCSGRAGVVARRGMRRSLGTPATLAIASVWRHAGGFEISDYSHTLVESFPNGWAWSVPVDRERRQFTVMVDRDTVSAAHGPLDHKYEIAIHQTQHFVRLLAGAERMSRPWIRDSSVYTAHRFAEQTVLLVGDAGAFVDPLGSIGVKKALTSAWRAAVVANTVLLRPSSSAMACEYFDARERDVVARCTRLSESFYAQAAARYDTPFWKARAITSSTDPSVAPTARSANAPYRGEGRDASSASAKRYGETSTEPLGEVGPRRPSGLPYNSPFADDDHVLDVSSPESWLRDPSVARAWTELRASPSIHLRSKPGLVFTKCPGIVGREVVLEDAVAGAGLAGTLRYVGGVKVPELMTIASAHQQVPDLFVDYSRRFGAVEFPEFLSALSLLVGKGILESQRDQREL